MGDDEAVENLVELLTAELEGLCDLADEDLQSVREGLRADNEDVREGLAKLGRRPSSRRSRTRACRPGSRSTPRHCSTI